MIYLGFDIGGTKCAAIIADADKDKVDFLSRDEIATEKQAPDIIIEKLCNIAEARLKEFNLKPASVGVSCGGPLNSKEGIILCPPNLPGWVNVPITEILSEKFNVPAYLQNDAKACAVAEWKWGAGKGCHNMIFCTMGTGFGAGIIINDKIYTGTNDMAGEVGHLRLAEDGPIGFGKAGSFEGFCSGGGIAQLAKRKAITLLDTKTPTKLASDYEELSKITTKKVCMLAQEGDKDALEIIRISAEKLGKGLALLTDILNPEAIVIGSVFARNVNLFKPIAEEVMKKECISYSMDVCRLLPALLGEKIGDYAAVSVAMNL
ncbi:MAG: ROK family protein [Armatimonadetes bacterium]|nr:ROK family protein [Candidatus Hippobium faecium]